MENCTAHRQGLWLKIPSSQCFLVCFADRKIPHQFSSAFFQINSLIHWSYGLNSKCRMLSLLYPVTDEIQSVQSLGMPKNLLQKMFCYAVKSNGQVLKNNCMQPSTNRRVSCITDRIMFIKAHPSKAVQHITWSLENRC